MHAYYKYNEDILGLLEVVKWILYRYVGVVRLDVLQSSAV
jgi:hypothetical protein